MESGTNDPSSWLRFARRRLAGAIWIAIWCGLLFVVLDPWRDLGGIVSERLRWLVWWTAGCGLIVGWLIGSFGRDAALPGSGRCHLSLLRVLLLPQAALAAAAMLWLRVTGRSDAIGLLFAGMLAYWAGLDLGFAVLPLLQGRPYHPVKSIAPDRAENP